MLSAALLNTVPFGIVVLSNQSKILFANTYASDLLRDNQELSATDGFLRAQSVPHSRALSDALQKLTESDNPEPVAFSVARSNKRPISVVLSKLEPARGKPTKPEKARIVAIVTDPDANCRPSSMLVRELFQFTPVESAIAGLMMESMDTERMADELNITRSTLRDHLKFMFQKVNVKSQTELLHTLLRSPAGFHFPSKKS